MRSFVRDGLTFEFRDEGPRDAEPVVLLHGWPGGAETWEDVAPALTSDGWRTLTPNQRGYSPDARPRQIRAYGMPHLVDDVLALLDAAAIERAHVIGHDWGGAVAWALASRRPDRVGTLTVLSTPHPVAMARALRSSDQLVRSGYVAAFQVPWVAERILRSGGGRVLRQALRLSGLDAARADRYVARQLRPGALRASLAWYRALPFVGADLPGDIAVPTLYVWSTGDSALGPAAADRTQDHVSGPYRFQILQGVSHWLPETVPHLVSKLSGAHLRAHPLV
jgi:pimeloyl-ACP methyl ester carboxylesterase